MDATPRTSFGEGPEFSQEKEKGEEKCEGETGKSDVDMYEKAGEFYMVVAALITTVTFAAGITMPGGFMGQDGPYPGSATLGRSAAFKAFVITNTISMLLSVVAILALVLMAGDFDDKKPSATNFRLRLFVVGFLSIQVALGAMMLAFVTGTYAVLAPHSMGFAVAVCLIGLSFFPILFLILRENWKYVD